MAALLPRGFAVASTSGTVNLPRVGLIDVAYMRASLYIYGLSVALHSLI